MAEMGYPEKWFVNSPLQSGLLRAFVFPSVFAMVTSLSGRILDLGCGRGVTTREIRRRFPDAEVVGVDYDEEEVELARRGLARRPDPRLRFVRGDATRLAFPDGSLDAVFEFHAFHHIADWPRAAEEAARVLKPGGLFVASDFTDRFTRPFRRLDTVEAFFTRDEFLGAVRGAGLRVRRSKGNAWLRLVARKR